MKRRDLWNLAGTGAQLVNRWENALPGKSRTVALFDPSVATENLGDEIIMDSCRRVLKQLFPQRDFFSVGTHTLPREEDAAAVRAAGYRFVCGTNLLTSHIEHSWRWVLPEGIRGKWPYRNVILLGVGWGEYQDACSEYSRMIYRCMLNPGMLHAVRDEYTARKLRQIGITNVLNTGCPTTWGLTPEFCRTIPTRKAKRVVAAVTDYRPDPHRDRELLAILGRSYEQVHLWPQGKGDAAYVNTLDPPPNLTLLPGTVESFTAVLNSGEVDYVGTRLHGGIHALNCGVRSIIIGVDNRAMEMGRDLSLPVLPREQTARTLEERIHRDFSCDIRIPRENIRQFTAQFENQS